MNTHSHHVCISQLQHGWHEQWPSKQGDLDLSIVREEGRVYYMGVDLLLILFLYTST
jgi:hypothetical protein